MKSFLQNNDIEMYSMHKEGKSAIAERFIRTLCIYVNIDKLDDIVNKYNNTYNSTIKMTPVDVKSNTYICSSKDINDKFKIGDIVWISQYKNIFEKITLQIGLIKVFVIKKS